jgi:MtN3 and saliva related transmembrane protein
VAPGISTTVRVGDSLLVKPLLIDRGGFMYGAMPELCGRDDNKCRSLAPLGMTGAALFSGMTRTELASLIGTVTGAITVLSFIPQAVSVWRTKRTDDLSFGTCVLLVIQAAGWTSYGVLLGQAPIIVTNSLVMLTTFAILAAKVKYGGKSGSSSAQPS